MDDASMWKPPKNTSSLRLSKPSRADLLDALDTSFADLSSEDFLLRLDQVEEAIAIICRQAILSSIGRDKREEAHILGNVVHIGDHAFILKLRPSVERDRVLNIVFQDAKDPQLDSSTSYTQMESRLDNSVGRYELLNIVLPLSLGANWCERATEDVVEVFTAGYFWLRERVQRSLMALESDFEQQSLRLFRRQFFIHDRAELAKKVWLVMVANNRVLYAVDGDVVGRVLDSAQNYAREVQQAPAAISAAAC
jgi:hypothetical protein